MSSSKKLILFFIAAIVICGLIALAYIMEWIGGYPKLTLDSTRIGSLDFKEAWKFYSEELTIENKMDEQNFKLSMFALYAIFNIGKKNISDLLLATDEQKKNDERIQATYSLFTKINNQSYNDLFCSKTKWKDFMKESLSDFFVIKVSDTPNDVDESNTLTSNPFDSNTEKKFDRYVSEDLKKKLFAKIYIINQKSFSVCDIMYSNWYYGVLVSISKKIMKEAKNKK